MTAVARRDVPYGSMPTYRELVRHVWSFSQHDGNVITPPIMASLLVEDGEIDVMRVAVAGLDAVSVSEAKAGGWNVDFRSLHALYCVTGHLVLRARIDEDYATQTQARVLVEVILWSLGFRWV